MTQLHLIVAHARNGVIGKDNKLPWYLPEDLKNFKRTTLGKPVIMGRKTFESLPNGPLPNRKNVVLTTIPEADFINCFACDSMGEALDLCKNEDEIFIIGGALVYRQAIRLADTMYITRVHAEFKDADAYFPNINWDLWEEVSREDFPADEKNAYPYSFITYKRKQ